MKQAVQGRALPGNLSDARLTIFLPAGNCKALKGVWSETGEKGSTKDILSAPELSQVAVSHCVTALEESHPELEVCQPQDRSQSESDHSAVSAVGGCD